MKAIGEKIFEQINPRARPPIDKEILNTMPINLECFFLQKKDIPSAKKQSRRLVIVIKVTSVDKSSKAEKTRESGKVSSRSDPANRWVRKLTAIKLFTADKKLGFSFCTLSVSTFLVLSSWLYRFGFLVLGFLPLPF